MRCIIKSDYDSDDLIEMGKDYFPRIIGSFDSWKISKRMKGVHRRVIVENELKVRKIIAIEEEFLAMITPYSRYSSRTTNSRYFSIKGINFRISDHGKSTFEGVDILITWRSNVKEILNQILLSYI